jgi:hypothetical protein
VAFTELRLIRDGHALLRLVGGILGGLGGVVVVTCIAVVTEVAAALVPAALLIIPASAAAGYYAGKLVDRRTTRITIRSQLSDAGEE